MTAIRETVLAALAADLATVAGVTGLTTARNRIAPVDGDRDLAAGPLLVLHDGDQTTVEEFPAYKRHRARPLIEGFLRGSDASALSTAMEALYAAAIAAIEGGTVQIPALRVRPGEMEPGLDHEAGHRAVVGFAIAVTIDYTTAPNDAELPGA